LAARAAKEILRLTIEFVLTTTPQDPGLAAFELDSGSPWLTNAESARLRHILSHLCSILSLKGSPPSLLEAGSVPPDPAFLFPPNGGIWDKDKARRRVTQGRTGDIQPHHH
jgi:hypothetical protein